MNSLYSTWLFRGSFSLSFRSGDAGVYVARCNEVNARAPRRSHALQTVPVKPRRRSWKRSRHGKEKVETIAPQTRNLTTGFQRQGDLNSLLSLSARLR